MNSFIKELLKDTSPYSELLQNTLAPIVVSLLLAITAWWIFNVIIRKGEKRYGSHPFFSNNSHLFALFKRSGHYVILTLVGIGLTKLLKVPIVEKLFYAFVIVLVSSLAYSILKHLIPYLEKKLASKTDTHVDDVILRLLEKFSGGIIFATAAILALDVLGLNVMPFIAGAGVVGIAIGFAAKDTLSNWIAGILLIMDRPFEVGDRIEVWSAPVNSATWGDVLDIGLRATKIQTTDNIVIVIPNNELMKRDIINYTSITKHIRVRIPIGIAYDADVNKAKEAIINIGLELDWVMEKPPPKVVVKSFGDSAVNLEARMWISDPRRRIDTISHITDRVKEVFQAKGIEIPYPKRDIYIKQESPDSNN
jgi:small-conductance mechanosensitive channel